MSKNRIQLAVALTMLVALGNSGNCLALVYPARGPVATRNVESPALDSAGSEMREMVESYNTDRGNLSRTYADTLSPTRRVRFKQFFEQWRGRLSKIDFDALSQDDRIDYLLFKNHLDHELHQLDEQTKQLAESEPLIPFAKTVFELEATRRRMEPIDSPKVATLLTSMTKQIETLRRALAAGPGAPSKADANSDSKTNSDVDAATEKAGSLKVKKNVANRTVAMISSLRNTLKNWFDYYNGYDPVFTWWVAEPYKAADQSLQNYASFMSEKVAGVRFGDAIDSRPATGTTGGGGGPEAERGQRLGAQGGRSANARPGDSSDIVGDPIGREALMAELASEMIPYTPEELIAIAKKDSGVV